MIASILKTFDEPQIADWKKLVEKELKGLSYEDYLIKNDEIEELSYHKFAAADSQKIECLGTQNRQNNQWKNNQYIAYKNSKIINEKALTALRLGTDSLTFDIRETIDWNPEIALKGIEADYIHTAFLVDGNSHLQTLHNYWGEHYKVPLIFWSDWQQPQTDAGVYLPAYHIQQAGGNAIQELSFVLAAAIDSAQQNKPMWIELGIGNHYFTEIAKIRALRHIVDQLNDQTSLFPHITISARTTFLNKSLKDPHTNLLRQTTEAMSAISGGVDLLTVQPYDAWSEAPTALAARMAINLSHILQEESYFQHVQDPMKGSYFIENLTVQLVEKVWKKITAMGETGGLLHRVTADNLRNEIIATAKKRVTKIKENKATFIGVNQYQVENSSKNNWKPLDQYWHLTPLILEKEQYHVG